MTRNAYEARRFPRRTKYVLECLGTPTLGDPRYLIPEEEEVVVVEEESENVWRSAYVVPMDGLRK